MTLRRLHSNSAMATTIAASTGTPDDTSADAAGPPFATADNRRQQQAEIDRKPWCSNSGHRRLVGVGLTGWGSRCRENHPVRRSSPNSSLCADDDKHGV